MANRQNPKSRLDRALEATGQLWLMGFAELRLAGNTAALAANTELEHTALSGKVSVFYRHHLRLRTEAVMLLAEMYRRFFRLALANAPQARFDPNEWTWNQLLPAVNATLEWICDWYILACDGENQYLRRAETIEFEPMQTHSANIPLIASPPARADGWRSPAWLFQISAALVGVGPLKSKHVPATDTEERLGEAHTRLLLKGTRRMFLSQLTAAIERVQNEETAAAGAILANVPHKPVRGPNKRKGVEQRLKLYSAIQKILSKSPELRGTDFCAALDTRHAPPLVDWMDDGDWRTGLTWKEAWSAPRLRRKIRRVRQEAMKKC
jgi:hypothetical protein